jgi:hypothetical protein
MEFEAEIKSYGFKSQQNGGAFAAVSKILLLSSDRNCAAFSARLQFARAAQSCRDITAIREFGIENLRDSSPLKPRAMSGVFSRGTDKHLQRDSRQLKIELALDAFHATKRQINLGGTVVCLNKKPQISKR